MKKFILCAIVTALFVAPATSQVIGKTTTEDYVGSFESRESIWSVPEYNGDPVSVALLNIGVTE